MRAALALAFLVACGTRPAAPEAHTRAAHADPWKTLDPRGDDWEAKLASIPEAQREEMAIALLRRGGFDCPTVSVHEGCARTEKLVGVAPSDGLGSPCLRRKLARWAVDQVSGETLAGRARTGAKELLESAALDPELAVAVFEKVIPYLDGIRRVVAIQQIERVREDLADDASAKLDLDDQWKLACQGVDGAMLALMDDHSFATDRAPRKCEGIHRLRRETRLALVAVLQKAEDKVSLLGLSDAYIRDCVVENALGRDRPSPRQNWRDAMCIALLRQEDVRELVTPGRLTVHHDTDDVNDDRNDLRYTDHVENDDDFELPFADEILRALPGCERDVCPVPGTTVVFKFQYDSLGRLLELERDETIGGCP